jgi:uncharacterized membrane protein
MHDVHLSNLLIGSGFLSVLAGVLQLLCQALHVRRTKRGRVRAELNLRKWSFQSISVAVMMVVIGMLLFGGGHFVDAQ